MGGSPWLKRYLALPTLLLLPYLATAVVDHRHDNDDGLSKFVTRPEFKAPKWKVNVTDAESVTPGYWFIAPLESIDQKSAGNGYIGPHIYDGNGDLVWSGVSLGSNWNVLDFRLSNVKGEERLTFVNQREGRGYILDNTFEIREKFYMGQLGRDFNSHELFFQDDGTNAIVLQEGKRNATLAQSKVVGLEEECKGLFSGFKVLDTTTWKPIFEWSSFDHIVLNESTYQTAGISRQCKDILGWDFVHLNSVDRDQHGDYYVSARHTDTIYKVSQHDGHIMWRLKGQGEPRGDFDMGRPPVRFSRQHNVRFRGFNGTHEIISILDNAKGQDDQKSTHENSRGLVLALKTDVKPMQVSIVSSIEHPYGRGHYAPRRGNYQILDNKNIFIGWSEQATHSEHLPNGSLVMEARLVTEWLGTYRSYKFPFVGLPKEPPKVHSIAHVSEARNSTTTMVHVSQNGATEIDSWTLYKTTETGEPKIPVFQKKKTGFETAIVWDGYASYVILEAVDKDGKVLATSEIVQTIQPGLEDLSAAVADELYWMQELHGENSAWKGNVYVASEGAVAGYFVAVFFLGAVCITVILVLVWWFRSQGGLFRGATVPKYQALDDHEPGEIQMNDPKPSTDGFGHGR